MREILFKAKRIDNGEWVEGHLIQSPYMGEVRSWISTPEDKTRLRAIATYYGDWRAVEVGTDTISQYTGLTDKNGNKIWENDVVKKHFYTDYDAYANSEEYVGIVKFTDCAWVIDTKKNERVCTRPIFESMAYSKDLDYFEVIGNIFDNEDLLKGE